MAELSTIRRGGYVPRGDFSAGGAVSGLVSGATVGSTFGPVGTVVGGVLGLVGGAGILGGGGPTAPGPLETAVRYAKSYGMIPSDGKTNPQDYFQGLLARGDPRALQLAQAAGVDIRKQIARWQEKEAVRVKQGRPSQFPTLSAGPAPVAGGVSAVSGCQCDNRAEVLLFQLLQALGGFNGGTVAT